MRAWIVSLCLIAASALGADDESRVYRLSYRKQSGAPWVFYADIRDKAKADHIAGTLHKIGFESQIVEVAASTPQPPTAPEQNPPPLQPPAQNLAPEPSVFGQGGATHFPSSNAGPYHVRTPYHAPMNIPFGIWGFGWGYNLGLQPQINHMYNQNYSSYRLNAPVHESAGSGYFGGHPTPHPGARR